MPLPTIRRLPIAAVLVLILAASVILAPSASAATFSAFSLSTTTVPGGTTLSATVRLAAGAPSGGQRFTFAASNAYATPPAAIVIAAGRMSGTARFATRTVDRPVSVTLTATSDGVERSVVVTLLPAKLASLTAPSTMVAGTVKNATVMLDANAVGPVVVALGTSDAAVASVPASVTIPSGKRTVSVPITTTTASRGTATITATVDGATKTDTTTVDGPQLSAVTLPTSLGNGLTGSGRVRLTGVAPVGGVAVTLTLPSGSPLAVPATVTIPAGKADVAFDVTAGQVTAASLVKVTAHYLALTKYDTVNVVPPPARVTSVVLTPDVALPNSLVVGTVYLDKIAPTALSVRITSDDSLVRPASSVRVPAGYIGAQFLVAVGNVTATVDTATITVRANDASASDTLTVQRNMVKRLTLGSDASVHGGDAGTAYVFMELAYSSAQGAIQLTSSDPAVLWAPATVGSASSTIYGMRIDLTTRPVVEETTVRLTARYGGSTQTIDVVVTPELRLSQTPTWGAFSPETGRQGIRLDLNGVAPAGGAEVAVTSSDPSRVPDQTILVPTGERGVAGVVSTVTGTLDATVTVTFTVGGVDVSRGLTVYAARLARVAFDGASSGWVYGGEPLPVTVALTAPAPAGGIVVALASSLPDDVETPATVTVPAGAASATLELPTRQTVEVPGPRGTITASLGSTSVAGAFSLYRMSMESLTLSTSEVTGGGSLTATIRLASTVRTTPIEVSFRSLGAAAMLDATALIGVGEREATVTFSTGEVSEPTVVAIRGSDGALTIDRSLTVLPNDLGGASLPDAPAEEPVVAETPAPAATATPAPTQEPTATPTPQPTMSPVDEAPVVEEPTVEPPAATATPAEEPTVVATPVPTVTTATPEPTETATTEPTDETTPGTGADEAAG